MQMTHCLRLFLLASLALTVCISSGRADLGEFIKKPDAVFSWKIDNKTETPEGTIFNLHLVSQVWHDITWVHELQVFLPKSVKPTTTMFLWNQGGKSGPTSMAMGMELAKKMNAPVAFLYGIPNQPLLEGKS